MADTTIAADRRLYAEELPTGRFGGPAPARLQPVTAKEAAANRAVLEAAVCRRRGGERS